jgi:hypothetical protein
MDHAGLVSLTIAVGIAVGLVYSRRTGWGVGGLVTPGLLALQASDPLAFAGALLLGVALSVVLRALTTRLCLYGRERVGVALLLAIALGLLLRRGTAIDAFRTGWAAPGLIAADAERQGAAMTLVGAIVASIATAFVMSLLMFAGERF